MTMRCPYCAEDIRPEALICPHCQKLQPAAVAAIDGMAKERRKRTDRSCAIILCVGLLLFVLMIVVFGHHSVR